ncbi:MAG: glycosyltransferase family 4 protein [Eudoraea sp.]|nr:glycosyltransferase family 4 protein [Eudoraea sp.]
MARRKLLILGLSWPEPKATAAGVRMMQLIDSFIQSGWDLTFASTAGRTKNGADLETMGITVQGISLNDEAFDLFLEELKPDTVLFDRFITEEQFGWRVADKVPNALRLLDTEDLHSLRSARKQALEQEVPFDITAWLRLEETKRELASIYRCDLSLIISKHEMQLLEDELKVPRELLLYLPLWTKTDYKSIDKIASFDARKDFVFIGNGKHLPNLDAIQYLRTSVWPIIRELMPTARINVYGAYLPEKVRSLHTPELGFHIHGYVENAHTAMQQARINLAPLRFGAGLKGKLLLALENGTPSITTSVGAEGILDHSIAGEFVFDQPEEFAREAVRLYQNEKEWLLLQAIGFDVLEAQFDGHHYRKVLCSTIAELSSQLEAHRTKNFIGAMLHHHSLQSTKYMSRWISCKNKLKALQ